MLLESTIRHVIAKIQPDFLQRVCDKMSHVPLNNQLIIPIRWIFFYVLFKFKVVRLNKTHPLQYKYKSNKTVIILQLEDYKLVYRPGAILILAITLLLL